MDSYTIIKRKENVLSLIFWTPIFPLYLWLASDSAPSGRYGNSGFITIPLYLSILIYELYHSTRPKSRAETLSIGSRRIFIKGDYETSVDLEWKKIEKIEVVNGITTKIIFHYKYKTEEVDLYSYQRTYKLIKALKYFGNGIGVVERWKIFKILYIPFW